MSSFEDLLSVNSNQVLQFFMDGLTEVGVPREIRKKEVAYIASTLSHYASTSCLDSNGPLRNLSEVHDRFVIPSLEYKTLGLGELSDPGILEVAGSQTLLLLGFFGEQMRRRHSLLYFEGLGQSFYISASQHLEHSEKKELLFSVAQNFPFWTATCQSMSRNFRDNQYLLKKKGS